MSGRVCGKHERWCPDGVCPYCEPAPATQWTFGMNRSLAEKINGGAEPAPRSGPPVVISYVSVEAPKDEHDALLASRYPSFHLTVDHPTTPEQRERFERFKETWDRVYRTNLRGEPTE